MSFARFFWALTGLMTGAFALLVAVNLPAPLEPPAIGAGLVLGMISSWRGATVDVARRGDTIAVRNKWRSVTFMASEVQARLAVPEALKWIPLLNGAEMPALRKSADGLSLPILALFPRRIDDPMVLSILAGVEWVD